jgi:CDP-glucose 4,6-dehydratase
MEELVTRGEQIATAYAGRRVLITGNTGFKGSWLALWLSRLGADVVGFSDRVPTDPSHFQHLALPYRTIFGDVADAEAICDAVARTEPEIVFHLAAQSLVRRSYADPTATYRTNVMGTLAVLEACRAAPSVRALVSATTDKVYRNREWDWGYREADELGGSDPYSASKSCVELLTDSYRHSFLGDGRLLVASVRAGNVIGGGDWAEDRLFPDIIRAAYGGVPLEIRNPRSTRPWQHVLDPLSGYLSVGARLLSGDADAGQAWNFGPVSRQRIEVGQIVAALQHRLPDLRINHVPDASGRKESGLLELDSSKAMTRLKWSPIWESEMIDHTLDWYRAFYERNTLLSEMQVDAFMTTLRNCR